MEFFALFYNPLLNKGKVEKSAQWSLLFFNLKGKAYLDNQMNR